MYMYVHESYLDFYLELVHLVSLLNSILRDVDGSNKSVTPKQNDQNGQKAVKKCVNRSPKQCYTNACKCIHFPSVNNIITSKFHTFLSNINKHTRARFCLCC